MEVTGEWICEEVHGVSIDGKVLSTFLHKTKELVRCKDCKWWDKKDGSNYGYCHACKHGYHSDHWEIGIYRKYEGNWFCADGELKE